MSPRQWRRFRLALLLTLAFVGNSASLLLHPTGEAALAFPFLAFASLAATCWFLLCPYDR